jgi:hypothetical protein
MKTNILSAEGQRAAPAFGAERFKEVQILGRELRE